MLNVESSLSWFTIKGVRIVMPNWTGGLGGRGAEREGRKCKERDCWLCVIWYSVQTHTHTHTHTQSLLVEKKESINAKRLLINGDGDAIQNTEPNFIFPGIWNTSIVTLGRECYKLLPPFNFHSISSCCKIIQIQRWTLWKTSHSDTSAQCGKFSTCFIIISIAEVRWYF